MTTERHCLECIKILTTGFGGGDRMIGDFHFRFFLFFFLDFHFLLCFFPVSWFFEIHPLWHSNFSSRNQLNGKTLLKEISFRVKMISIIYTEKKKRWNLPNTPPNQRRSINIVNPLIRILFSHSNSIHEKCLKIWNIFITTKEKQKRKLCMYYIMMNQQLFKTKGRKRKAKKTPKY